MNNKYLIVISCFFVLWWNIAQGADDCSDSIFQDIDLAVPSNAVFAIKSGVSVGDFLTNLFQMNFSKDATRKRFGGANLADIAAGSLVYNEEFRIARNDWDSLVDAFLMEGFLTALDQAHRKGFEILLWQRDSPTIQAFIEKLKLEKPSIMKGTK